MSFDRDRQTEDLARQDPADDYKAMHLSAAADISIERARQIIRARAQFRNANVSAAGRRHLPVAGPKPATHIEDTLC